MFELALFAGFKRPCNKRAIEDAADREVTSPMTTTNPTHGSDIGELLTFTQAAQRLGVDVLTVRRWVRTE
jgi:hypothetical protein